MLAKSSKNDGASLLSDDGVKVSASTGEEPLNLSGALDILWQIKDKDMHHVVIQVESEPFLTDFFDKVRILFDSCGIGESVSHPRSCLYSTGSPSEN